MAGAQLAREAKRARVEAQEDERAPLAREQDWKSAAGPRVPEDRLRARLREHLLAAPFQATLAAELGGECVDLSSFARVEIFSAHTRDKEAMRGAKQVLKDPALRTRHARAWVTKTLPLHAAQGEDRLGAPWDQRCVRRQIRKGSPAQSHGFTMTVDDFVALYKEA
jgi:hypothetical protein